ncbi:hypothetical protein GYB61_11325 [bacterium]|nr:hypothetical protein [bacterium]
MALQPILESNPETIQSLSIQQLVALCGDGKLRDNSDCCVELRLYLRQASNAELFAHAQSCLDTKFENSGFVLQDVVNELGRRLDFRVENGLFHGRSNTINSDGYWGSTPQEGLIVEVKTTDSYRINLDKIAKYRTDAISEGITTSKSSILIIVGRQDTGDLEAQVRGSRHAWDVRIISVEALTKLVTLKEETEENTVEKIREILRPIEYTRLDNIIDLAFVAASEIVDDTSASEDQHDEPNTPRSIELTPKGELEAAREKGKLLVENEISKKLLKRSRATYWTADEAHSNRATLSVSKRYKTGYYWYTHHRTWREFVRSTNEGGFFRL